MKKILSIVIVLSLLLSLLSGVAVFSSDELLFESFESEEGSWKHWSSAGKSLNSISSDCATDGENYAIIKDSHTIVYYLSSNDEYKEIEGFLSLGQIAITNLKGVNELWFSDNGSIYHVPLTSLSNFKIADLENYIWLFTI